LELRILKKKSEEDLRLGVISMKRKRKISRAGRLWIAVSRSSRQIL
jgi:hypothetical protein